MAEIGNWRVQKLTLHPSRDSTGRGLARSRRVSSAEVAAFVAKAKSERKPAGELHSAARPTGPLHGQPRVSRRQRKRRVGAQPELFTSEGSGTMITAKSQGEAHERREPDRGRHRRRHVAPRRERRFRDGAGKHAALVQPDRRHPRAGIVPSAQLTAAQHTDNDQADVSALA